MLEEVKSEHLILYTDAGWLLEAKHAGCGVHGYFYKKEEPKRGTGNAKVVPTHNGYKFTCPEGKYSVDGDKVTVSGYVDIIFSPGRLASNNEAELMAFYKALVWLDEIEGLTSVKIFSDSKFVVTGTTVWLEKWAARNWILSNGEQAKYRPLWEKVRELYNKLSEKIPEFVVGWVKGHKGHPGNEQADSHATKGLVMSQKNDLDVDIGIAKAQGYWNAKAEIPRIMQAPRWYFSTTDEDYLCKDGRIKYYIGSHGTTDKEDELVGKRYSDNFLGVVAVANPDPILELLRETAIRKDSCKIGCLVVGYLDSIFSNKNYLELSASKTRYLIEHSKRIDVSDSKKKPILVEMTPVGLGFRQVSTWQQLSRILNSVREGDPFYRITDITDLLYEAPDAKKGLRKLKSSISQITKFLDFKVEFNLEKQKDEPKPFMAKVRLIVGSDILTRNQLAAIAEDVQCVKVVSWRTSDTVGRYATLVELKSGDIGIWARYESNIMFKPE